MRNRLSIAAAQPHCAPGDLATNASHHVDTLRSIDAHLVVFPELSLSGYDLSAPPVDLADDVFTPIMDACAERRMLALVGAAVHVPGGDFIATLAVTGERVTVAYRKTSLSDDEARAFTAGDGPRRLNVDGWWIGLGICKDTRSPDHIDGTLALGIDLYVAGLVHHDHELPQQDERAARIVERGQVPVAFASAAGSAGPTYPRAAGHSCIWAADGTILARSGATPGEIAITTLTP